MDKETDWAVIDMMEEQKQITNKGGTMRLGAYTCKLQSNSLAHKIYGRTTISERHRHRYEFNNRYREDFAKSGMVLSGINPENDLVEVIELANHPFFIGVQYHPELKSTVMNPHPLFVHFVKAASKYAQQKREITELVSA
jgi:CTP synthase